MLPTFDEMIYVLHGEFNNHSWIISAHGSEDAAENAAIPVREEAVARGEMTFCTLVEPVPYFAELSDE